MCGNCDVCGVQKWKDEADVQWLMYVRLVFILLKSPVVNQLRRKFSWNSDIIIKICKFIFNRWTFLVVNCKFLFHDVCKSSEASEPLWWLRSTS